MSRRGPEVTPELAAEHGLSADEYQLLLARLGRTPTYTELGVVSVMWSEHCSYKSSRVHLKGLPTTGERVIQGPGENAGVVDIDDGQAVVFKMESHNHPSYIEPYQGAATGVGGICRDVFTMGARPIALADCLRFGPPEHERTEYLVNGVVAGIAGYGNSFGVPNVAGDVAFDASYAGNILVNAFCLGVADSSRIFYGKAAGVGNPIIYVGAKTGRDGIHGATMASAEFGDDADAKRPAVQVGDPFMEKLLLEACLELMQTDALVGIQDMGAAGLTSSSVEMAARAGSGVRMHLERVPQRETNMTPYELLLSESQERMLMVVEKGRERVALDIFDKWDLDAAIIGEVTDTGRVEVLMDGELCADLPAEVLAEGLAYERPTRRPEYLDEVAAWDRSIADTDDPGADLLALLRSPNVASKAWVYRQYDHNVRHGTVLRPGQAGAGVVRVRTPDGAREKGVAVSAGCNSRYVYLEPHSGAQLAIAEAYANLSAVGARPLAVTDCLNFGNPEKPEIMWQFVSAVRGLGAACAALGTPIVSGNVSLYNETDGVAIKPTPMIAMVGLMDDVHRARSTAFAAADHVVAVMGDLDGELGGSEYLSALRGATAGVPRALDPAPHKRVCDTVRELIEAGLLGSAHDISDGGLLPAVAECSLLGGLGAELSLPAPKGRLDELLFGEGPARFVVSYARDQGADVAQRAREARVPVLEIGRVGGRELSVSVGGRRRFSVSMAEIDAAFAGAFEAAITR